MRCGGTIISSGSRRASLNPIWPDNRFLPLQFIAVVSLVYPMTDIDLNVTTYERDRTSINTIRTQVFQLEQGVDPALEFDGLDEAAQHIVAYLDGRPVATARMRQLTPHLAKLERVAVLQPFRGLGLGKQVTLKALEWMRSQSIATVKIHAQTPVQEFYEKLGFIPRGDVFEEAGIPHVEMLKVLMPRIVSLIPSATEIVDCLGLIDNLVARSHECDYPAPAQKLPACTRPKFNPAGTSSEIHDRVTNLLQTALSVYQIETDVLETLQPTHILTQAQCEVCAVSLADVEQAVADLTHSYAQIISLQPNTLAEVWQDIQRVGDCLGVSQKAEDAIATLQIRVANIADQAQAIAASDRPRVACIEWTDPLMAAGNWIPELVELAGGVSLFGTVGQHSPWLNWEELVAASPEVLVIMPCGYDLHQTQQDMANLHRHPAWSSLPAVKTGRVYITDGNQYFNRPGPRLVDSLEILAEILHPEQFQFDYEGKGWQKVSVGG